ncbi:MAG: hypothetical protein IJB79_08690 [Candidatus Gastranaerophilales bacterium]|nr:hypothetical protein [Candidatus Gastranaerophilales bacterium]
MQESLLNTVQKLKAEPKINVEELEVILNSDIEEVVTLCKKACVKPKTDNMGNAYFTKTDVDMLKKMKELYAQNQAIQNQTEEKVSNTVIEQAKGEQLPLSNPNKKINFLEKAKTRAKGDSMTALAAAHPATQLANKLENLENNLVNRMSEILSEKMDGFDEIIVELIRAKTENENLRQQVNSLNKQVFILKNELASFSALPFGFYTKKETDSL